jgi:stringent starvation protein B
MSIDNDIRKQKIACYEEWMKGDHVLVRLDSRRDGVEVPAHLQGNPSLVLQLSYLFQGETKHDENEISAYLKFKGQYHRCVIPWDAVWGISNEDDENRIWVSELPPEILEGLTASAPEAQSSAADHPPLAEDSGKDETAVKSRPSLTVVDKSAKRKPPVLKRVK